MRKGDVNGVCVISDDEPLIAKLMGLIVRRTCPDLSVRVFMKSRDALECLMEEEVSMLITDMVMPERSGADLIDAARARWGKVPVVLLTASGAVGSDVMSFETLCYLRKPFRNEELLRSLEEAPSRALADARAMAWDTMRLRILGKHSGVLRVYGVQEVVGSLGLHRGRLVHAEDARGTGREAWGRMWREARVERVMFDEGGVEEQSVAMGHEELLACLNGDRR